MDKKNSAQEGELSSNNIRLTAHTCRHPCVHVDQSILVGQPRAMALGTAILSCSRAALLPCSPESYLPPPTRNANGVKVLLTLFHRHSRLLLIAASGSPKKDLSEWVERLLSLAWLS